MPRLRLMGSTGASRNVTDVFGGYRHEMKIRDGEFYDTENLSCEHYPMLATRKRRGVLARSFTRLQGIIAKDALCWVDNGTLYVNGAATGLTGLQTASETQLVSMGAYICVFPDKKYYNTQKPDDFGSMDANWNNMGGTVTLRMCHQDGTVYEHVYESELKPEDPQSGDVWIDADDTARVYDSFSGAWTELETVYTRVDFTTQGQIPRLFRELDAVRISGLWEEELNGSKILFALGGRENEESDWIVVAGIQGATAEQAATVYVRRVVPDMDYVCEAQNRLWGCFYGNDGTQSLNEIYCCALGDFRNWEQYLGLSTDSWRASRGSDGPWTGCCNYLGTPTFFKENVIHPVGISSVGAHQIGDIPARGVQKGSWRSLAVVGETLYYKSRTGVMAYQGGIPAEVGDALGGEMYSSAVAGVFGQRYYISMKDRQDAWHLFCCDTARGIWMREDSLHAEEFAAVDDELYVRSGNRLIALNGTAGTLEEALPWMAETGVIHYDRSLSGAGVLPVRYLSRFGLRVQLQAGGLLQLYIEYDSDGKWVFSGEVKARRLGSYTLPVRPRRCDHLRLRLVGEGEMRLFSLAQVLEKGSDV